ncbi:MAG: tRNA (N6-isopentenyl adenosine(37)-C2)-methylthiotransferase MiaB [Bdellovibrionales bacterium]|nr:tRNA (N6-isopentenyl adenosine(37)-C2)-methylthiotransferase MiaB [Bdellovibrionales bacterium]
MKGLFVQTYGCQMNASDSDRMKAVLAPLGYEAVRQPEDADLVLINTCSVREKAENKMESFAHELKRLKVSNPGLKIGVTGCVAQQEKEQIQKDLPFVDIVLGPDNIDELPWALEELSANSGKRILRAEFDSESRVWDTQTALLNPGPTAFISVMKGCDHFCSYCVVPMTRGREKSRPIADILTDVRALVARGTREITFLGQNINTFGKRAGESLDELFRRAHDIEGLHRIRFTTSHPGDLRDELIRCFEELPKLCSQFHLPFQSGSDRILRAMRRFYTREQYLERARALRQARPDIAFSTDIIVGFPGETEEDFEATYSLLSEVEFDNAYSFLFSPRPGTAAALRKDDTSEATKMIRLNKLQERVRSISLKLHRADVGQTKEILLEGPSKKDPTRWTGRTSQNVPTHVIAQPEFRPGDLLRVKITEGTITHLKGELLAPAQFSTDSVTTPSILGTNSPS